MGPDGVRLADRAPQFMGDNDAKLRTTDVHPDVAALLQAGNSTFDATRFVLHFWARTRRARGSDCILWTGPLNKKDGYGLFKHNGQRKRTHRFAYEQKYGPIPPGMLACHRCDVRRCVNPDHIFLGTHDENMLDMSIKGRARNGSTGRLPVKFAVAEVGVYEDEEPALMVRIVAGNRHGTSDTRTSSVEFGISGKTREYASPPYLFEEAER